MPNTLGHLGLQALLTARLRADVRLDDLRWVALGCVLPDLPWILRRAVLIVAPGFDDISLRAYAIVQSSLLVSLLIAAAFACVAAHPRRAAFLLAANVVLHLALDAVQTKWGNGVLFFAPMDFHPFNLGWFWPESAASLLLTATGAAIVVLGFKGPATPPSQTLAWKPPRALAAVVLLMLWLAIPFAWMDAVLEADAHALRTLALTSDRTGAEIGFDRTGVQVDRNGQAWIEGALGAPVRCAGECPATAGRYSLRGRFESHEVFRSEAWHRHESGVRDGASYLGLLGVVALWCRGLRGGRDQS